MGAPAAHIINSELITKNLELILNLVEPVGIEPTTPSLQS